MMSIFIDGFFGKKLYAIIPAIRFDAKLSIERCLVCSMLQTFLSSSLTVSMSALFRIRILSCMFMRGVLHVHLEFCHKVYAVNEKPLEKLLAYVSPVGKNLTEKPSRKVLVLQWLTVVHVSRRESPLYYLATVVIFKIFCY